MKQLSAVVVAIAVGLLMIGAASASAEMHRTTVTYEFGPDGTSATSFPGTVDQIDYNEIADQLVVMTDAPREIFTFDVGAPGVFTPVAGGHFPVAGSGEESGMAVSPFTGKIYVADEDAGLYGYSPTGALLPNFPVTAFPLTGGFTTKGEACGVSVNSEGMLFVADGVSGATAQHNWVEVLDPVTAEPAHEGFGTAELAACSIQVDRLNDDFYGLSRGGGAIRRLLYKTGYSHELGQYKDLGYGFVGNDLASDPISRDLLVTENPGFSGTHKLTRVPREPGQSGGEGMYFPSHVGGVAAAPDGTSYVGVDNKVAEVPFAQTPTAVSDPPAAASTAGGTVDPDGQGPITECFFQWGTSPDYWENPNEQPCNETTPISTAQAVTADLPGLVPGQTYYYRVVAGNAHRGGRAYGADETITPPLVTDLRTEGASGVTRSTATLHGSFTGNGSNATYYFKWGQFPNSLVNSTPAAPAEVPSASGHVPLSVSLPNNLALDTTYYYRVVATNSNGTSEGLIESFTTKGFVFDVDTKPATGLTLADVTLNGEFVGTGEPAEYFFEWGLTSSYGSNVPATPTDAGEPNGLTQASTSLSEFEAGLTYHYRLVVTNTLGTTYGDDETFTSPSASPPDVNGTGASGVTANGATLEAQIDPNRKATIYLFEYGVSPGYGSATPTAGPIPGVPAGSTPVDAVINLLAPGTVYHFRVVATNLAGTTYGPDQTFLTPGPPTVGGPIVASITSTSATVSTQVAPSLSATTSHFEYGTTEAYGSRTPESAPLAGDAGPQPISAVLSGLTPDTTYHVRAVATNAFGETFSTDGTFRTDAAANRPEQTQQPAQTRCKRGFVKRKGRCVRKHRKRGRSHRGGNGRS